MLSLCFACFASMSLPVKAANQRPVCYGGIVVVTSFVTPGTQILRY